MRLALITMFFKGRLQMSLLAITIISGVLSLVFAQIGDDPAPTTTLVPVATTVPVTTTIYTPPVRYIIQTPARLKGVEFVVACDVTTAFTDAAKVFGPQKGASPAQVQLLTTRLERLVQMYKETHGVDVSLLPGAGAAGGLAGGLAALGAKLVPGFDLVAQEVLLDELLIEVDFIITGEGYMDNESFSGKVVGSMAELAAEKRIQISAICGDIHQEVQGRLNALSLVELFGRENAMQQPLHCIEQAALQLLRNAK